MTNDSTQYIARISYGKDSLKMLDVIKSRGLPLDRITTTDVWATDTISANLPPMEQFKARMDQRIWDMYRIEVEHLCALNPDGTKKTYEQMFYHVPKRKNSQSVQVERERERETGYVPARSSDSRICGTRGVKLHSSGVPMHRVQGNITGFPPNTRYNWCQKLKIPWGGDKRLPLGGRCDLVSEIEAKNERPQGYPAQISPWCRKLKIDKVKTPFPESAPRGAETEISWNIWELLPMSLSASGN